MRGGGERRPRVNRGGARAGYTARVNRREGRGRRGRSRGWRSGAAPPPPPREELEVHTHDGANLRAVLEEPAEGVPLRGVFVLAHALFARGSSFGREGRPGLRALLAARGYRTLVFDFRGHGASRAPRAWRYDDLVRFDLPAMIELARARSDGLPVLVAGHSLGGHVTLAAHGTGRTHVDGILALATNLWLPEIEPSFVLRAAKRAFARATLPVVSRTTTVPARRLGIGSDDAPSEVVRMILELALGRPWKSEDGEDYLAALAKVEVPVCAVVSDGDRLACTPTAGASFARRCRGPVEIVTIGHSDDGGPPPGHMRMVTSLAARTSLERAIAWLDGRVHLGEADLGSRGSSEIV